MLLCFPFRSDSLSACLALTGTLRAIIVEVAKWWWEGLVLEFGRKDHPL